MKKSILEKHGRCKSCKTKNDLVKCSICDGFVCTDCLLKVGCKICQRPKNRFEKFLRKVFDINVELEE